MNREQSMKRLEGLESEAAAIRAELARDDHRREDIRAAIQEADVELGRELARRVAGTIRSDQEAI